MIKIGKNNKNESVSSKATLSFQELIKYLQKNYNTC